MIRLCWNKLCFTYVYVVRSYLPRIASSSGNVVHASQLYNELRDSATDIEKTYRNGSSSKSELIEA